jgi:2-dehydro-3-deoxygluconokinase
MSKVTCLSEALAMLAPDVPPRALPLDVVELTGTRDAFAAGYLAGAVRRLPLQGRLGLAVRAAREALRVSGDIAPLSDSMVAQ